MAERMIAGENMPGVPGAVAGKNPPPKIMPVGVSDPLMGARCCLELKVTGLGNGGINTHNGVVRVAAS